MLSAMGNIEPQRLLDPRDLDLGAAADRVCAVAVHRSYPIGKIMEIGLTLTRVTVWEFTRHVCPRLQAM